MCIVFVLNVGEHQKCFLKTRAVRNSCSKGEVDRSKNVLAETDMIYVYVLHSKCGRTPEILSILRPKLFQRRWKVKEQTLLTCVHNRAIVNTYKQSEARKTRFQVSTRSFPPIVAVDWLNRIGTDTGTYLHSLSPPFRTDLKWVEVCTLS